MRSGEGRGRARIQKGRGQNREGISTVVACQETHGGERGARHTKATGLGPPKAENASRTAPETTWKPAECMSPCRRYSRTVVQCAQRSASGPKLQPNVIICGRDVGVGYNRPVIRKPCHRVFERVIRVTDLDE